MCERWNGWKVWRARQVGQQVTCTVQGVGACRDPAPSSSLPLPFPRCTSPTPPLFQPLSPPTPFSAPPSPVSISPPLCCPSPLHWRGCSYTQLYSITAPSLTSHHSHGNSNNPTKLQRTPDGAPELHVVGDDVVGAVPPFEKSDADHTRVQGRRLTGHQGLRE